MASNAELESFRQIWKADLAEESAKAHEPKAPATNMEEITDTDLLPTPNLRLESQADTLNTEPHQLNNMSNNLTSEAEKAIKDPLRYIREILKNIEKHHIPETEYRDLETQCKNRLQALPGDLENLKQYKDTYGLVLEQIYQDFKHENEQRRKEAKAALEALSILAELERIFKRQLQIIQAKKSAFTSDPNSIADLNYKARALLNHAAICANQGTVAGTLAKFFGEEGTKEVKHVVAAILKTCEKGGKKAGAGAVPPGGEAGTNGGDAMDLDDEQVERDGRSKLWFKSTSSDSHFQV